MERGNRDDVIATEHELGGDRMLTTTIPDARSRRRDFPPPPAAPLDSERMRGAVASTLFGTTPPESPRVGRYSLLKRLGQGGMGVVYSAYDEDLDRRVALKLVREDAIDPEYGKARLTREAKALAKLSHANVVSVFEVGTHAGRLFVAMEYVDGRTLRDWMSEAPRSVNEIIEVFAAAARGLAAAHEAGLVHRDFKPDNVLLDDRDRVRVVDFGLARAPRAGTHDAPALPDQELPLDELTRTGALLGTPAYMAPEQLRDGVANAGSDQFAFCVALYEAVYGRRPFAGRSAAQLRQSIEAGPSLPPGGKATAALRSVLTRGLSPNPEARFESMTALLAQLIPPTQRRSPLAVAAIALGALVLGGGVGFGFLPSAQLAPCPDAGAEAETLWTDARQSSVADDRARALVDDRVDRWVTAQVAACADEGIPTEVAAARRRCAADHLRELDATLAYFESHPVDPVTLEHVLWETGDPRRCTDGRAGHLPPELVDAQLGERIAIRVALAEAVLDAARGDSEGATQRAAALTPRARILGSGSVDAEVLLGQAQIQNMAGANEKALALTKDAAVAARRGGDPIREGAALAYSAGNRGAFGPLDEATELTAQARAVADAIGPDPRVDAYLSMADAILAFRADPNNTVPGFQAAYEASQEGLSPYHLNQTAAANNLGVAYRDSGQPDRAVETWEAGLAMAERLDPNSPQVIYPLYNLCHLYLGLGQHDRAIAAGQRALEVARSTSLPESDNVRRSLDNLAEALAAAGEWSQLVVLFEEKVELSRPLRDEAPILFAADVFDLQVALWLADGTPPDEDALRLARTTLEANRPLPKLQQGDLYWVIRATEALARHDAGRSGAASMAREAVAGMEALLPEDPELLISWIRGVAALVLADSDPADALRLAKLSLAVTNEHHSPLIEAAAADIRRRLQAWVDDPARSREHDVVARARVDGTGSR